MVLTYTHNVMLRGSQMLPVNLDNKMSNRKGKAIPILMTVGFPFEHFVST